MLYSFDYNHITKPSEIPTAAQLEKIQIPDWYTNYKYFREVVAYDGKFIIFQVSEDGKNWKNL